MELLIKLEFENEKEAENAKKVLEDGRRDTKRCSSELIVEGRRLEVRIFSEDVVALRAAANTYLRLLTVFMSTSKIGGV